MSITDKLKRIKAALLTVSQKTYHYAKPDKVTAEYIVWMESTEDNSFHTDNGKTEQQIIGYIDLYTQKEFSPLVDGIQNALNDAEIGYRLSSVQYEDDAKLIHYDWEFYL